MAGALRDTVSGIFALEKAIRGSAKNLGDNVIVPKLGTSFDTSDEAYDLHNIYSWEKGFGIRYDKSRLNVERTKCMQEIVCGRAGKAFVENTKSCRCECPALIRLQRSNSMDNGWYIADKRCHTKSTSGRHAQIVEMFQTKLGNLHTARIVG
uniref:FAR1 domain-containing protein n=1 Tax=Aegilops tauschii TaxID=37682 RepID=M8BCG3_AEGTA